MGAKLANFPYFCPAMRLFYGWDGLPEFRRATVTVGTFDGVHRGHRALLEKLIERAQALDGESIVITFDPHPRTALGREVDVLMHLPEKIALIETLGVDNLIVIPFDRQFAELTAHQFVGDYLVGKIGMKELVAGFDHRFGSDKNSNFEALGREFGFAVTPVDPIPGISSSRIRELLRQGRKEEAQQLLLGRT